MRNILQYFHERFPIVPVLLYAAGYAGLLIGNLYTTPKSLSLFITITLIFTCFLFRQRVVDEFRDFAHDAKYFPHRPVQRGLVSKKQVVTMGILAFLLELVLILRISPLIRYIPILLFNVLMANDFYIKPWLDKHFTEHFFIHESFFIIFGWFFISSLSPQLPFTQLIQILIILVSGSMSVELVRKYKPRYSNQGKIVKDSYCAVWGTNKTLSFLIFLTSLIGLFSFMLKTNYLYLLATAIFCSIIFLVRKSDKLVIVAGAGQFLLFALFSVLF